MGAHCTGPRSGPYPVSFNQTTKLTQRPGQNRHTKLELSTVCVNFEQIFFALSPAFPIRKKVFWWFPTKSFRLICKGRLRKAKTCTFLSLVLKLYEEPPTINTESECVCSQYLFSSLYVPKQCSAVIVLSTLFFQKSTDVHVKWIRSSGGCVIERLKLSEWSMKTSISPLSGTASRGGESGRGITVGEGRQGWYPMFHRDLNIGLPGQQHCIQQQNV